MLYQLGERKQRKEAEVVKKSAQERRDMGVGKGGCEGLIFRAEEAALMQVTLGVVEREPIEQNRGGLENERGQETEGMKVKGRRTRRWPWDR